MSAAALDGAREPELARYEDIYAHAELELELAGRGEIDSLIALDARWEELIAGLPVQPPPAAAELLQRARLGNRGKDRGQDALRRFAGLRLLLRTGQRRRRRFFRLDGVAHPIFRHVVGSLCAR